jgi:hypothetical protein
MSPTMRGAVPWLIIFAAVVFLGYRASVQDTKDRQAKFDSCIAFHTLNDRSASIAYRWCKEEEAEGEALERKR